MRLAIFFLAAFAALAQKYNLNYAQNVRRRGLMT